MKGIIFDLDGTLIDNMMVHHRAWQRKLRELGLDYSLERVKEEIHGVNLEILARLFGEKYSLEERKQIAWDKEAAYREIFAPEITPLPGLMEFLDRTSAANIPMAIATAGPPENCFFALDALGIRDYFGHVVHSAMVSKGKPHPEAFQQAADGIGVKLSDCLVFEDSITGAQAAANGGCPAIIITTTHAELEFSEFDHILEFRQDYQGLNIEKYFSKEQ
ncbi:beta-phosphoglucomutase [Lewinellaceae bacterium SD302]|nr:beta-phosphoglucomutase [Lewinellaceae bacterium SD302]